VLHNTAVFWPTQLALLGIIPPTEITQRLVLWLGFYDSGTNHWYAGISMFIINIIIIIIIITEMTATQCTTQYTVGS
jgi:hypothetical protein